MAIFRPKPWVNPFGKMSIFPLFELFGFYTLQRSFFVLEYRKRYFPGLNRLKKNWKNGHLWTKPWVNPFGKMSIFRLFALPVLIAQKGVFFVLEYRKRHSPGLYCLKKKVGKMAIFGQKPWVNPFGKMSIFRLFELLFSQARKAFFRSRIS